MGLVKGAEDEDEKKGNGTEVDEPVTENKGVKGKKRLQEEEPREAENLRKKRGRAGSKVSCSQS